MSLINDALKRARESQEPGPAAAPSAPQLRPVEQSQTHLISPIYLIIGMGMLAIVLGLLLVWQLAQRRDLAQRIQARAPETQSSPAAEVSTPQPAIQSAATPVPAPKPATAPATASESKTPPTVAAVPPAAAPAEAKTSDTTIAPAPAPAATAPAVPQPEPVKTPILKLQGITFHPTRPAAMINGRTLFIGDRTGEWRVIAITRDTATLVNGAKTNTLTME